MPRKKKDDAPEPSGHACQAPGCREEGLYKAPRSKTALHDYRWYCLDHVREYNQQWDFFDGMDRDAIEIFMRDAVTGHRPTWRRESGSQRQYEELHEAIEAFLRSDAPRRRKTPGLTPKLNEALAIMDMDYPCTAGELKTRYRALVKKFHPDANKGDKKAEEKFKQVAVAYLLLSEHLKNG